MSSRFISSNALSQAFLARTEADYHMVIHIRENGIPFLYKGSWQPDTDRLTLIDKARTSAQAQGVFMDQAPFSSTWNCPPGLCPGSPQILRGFASSS